MEVSLIVVIAFTFFNIIRMNIATASRMKQMLLGSKK